GATGLNRSTHPAPEIQLPAHRAAQGELIARIVEATAAEAGVRAARLAGARTACRRVRAHDGKQAGTCRTHQRVRLSVAGFGLDDAEIRLGHLPHESIEHRI